MLSHFSDDVSGGFRDINTGAKNKSHFSRLHFLTIAQDFLFFLLHFKSSLFFDMLSDMCWRSVPKSKQSTGDLSASRHLFSITSCLCSSHQSPFCSRCRSFFMLLMHSVTFPTPHYLFTLSPCKVKHCNKTRLRFFFFSRLTFFSSSHFRSHSTFYFLHL